MFDDLATTFTNCDLLDSDYVDEVESIAESYVSTNGITNHRTRKYIFGGAVLFFLNNNTDSVYRPSTIAEKLGEDFSPSEVTFSAYKLSDHHDIEYNKPTSREFAHKYARELECSDSVFEMIDFLYNDVGELPGKSNSGTGAALVYIASLIGNDKRTQQSIAEVSGRSEVGIRNLYYEVLEDSSLDIEIGSKA